MSDQSVTMARDTIHNPGEPRHFMRLKPVTRTVRVSGNGKKLAESSRALRLTEIGKDVYDPMFYIPCEDVTGDLEPIAGRSTHCPLKGDASYFSLGSGDPIAWTYDRPFPFTQMLKGLIAFYPDEVTVEEVGTNI